VLKLETEMFQFYVTKFDVEKYIKQRDASSKGWSSSDSFHTRSTKSSETVLNRPGSKISRSQAVSSILKLLPTYILSTLGHFS